MGVSTVSGPWGRPLAVRIKGFSRGRTRPRRLKRKKGRDARMSLVIAQIINGLQTGSIFALVALGYSMVYGIILLLNFAHGDIIMVGAYMTFYAITTFHLHPLLSVVLAVVVSTLLGVVIEKVAYTPLRSAPRLSLLITAIGISFLLENGAQLIFGADSKSMDPMVTGNLSVGGISISYAALITILVSVAAMLLLTFLVQGTKLGKAMRAVSEDMGAAQLMGININKTISFTFAVGSALAGIGSAPTPRPAPPWAPCWA